MPCCWHWWWNESKRNAVGWSSTVHRLRTSTTRCRRYCFVIRNGKAKCWGRSTPTLPISILRVGRTMVLKPLQNQRGNRIEFCHRLRLGNGGKGESDVRFTPESGHVRCNEPCLLWAKSGLMQCSKTTRIGAYSITSSEAQ